MYDTTRKRIIKTKGSTAMLFQNSDLRSAQLLLRDFTVYPSAFLTQSDTKITKHYYAGTKRIDSRIEMKTASEPNTGVDTELQLKQESDLMEIVKKLDCKEYKYEFNQFEAEVEDDDTIALMAEVPSPVFFYHPDHLGSSTVISNSTGAMHQYFFNLPFGETMIEGCNNTSYQLNHKFNGKELDAESNMYYYGARYYDPRISVWMSVDPLVHKYPNLSPYCFSANNTFNVIDPNGQYLFGLFGSTKEQREEARAFADKHNGKINKIYSNDISVGYQTGGNGPEAEVIWRTQHFYRDGFRTKGKWAKNGNGSDGGMRGGAPLTTNKGWDRQGPSIRTKGETDQPINIDKISQLSSPPNERAGNILDLARIINDWTNLAGILGYGEEKKSSSGDIYYDKIDTIYSNTGMSIRKTRGSIHYKSIEDSLEAVDIIHKLKNTVIYE